MLVAGVWCSNFDKIQIVTKCCGGRPMLKLASGGSCFYLKFYRKSVVYIGSILRILCARRGVDCRSFKLIWGLEIYTRM